jgi:hypothetical protein
MSSDEMHGSTSPSDYRQKNPYNPRPAEYKPPSVLAEHKGLAILFAVILVAFAVYCLRTPHRPHAPPPKAAGKAPPIYIETVPDQNSR